MILQLSAVFKIQNQTNDSEIMFAKLTLSFDVSSGSTEETTGKRQYDALKKAAEVNLPEGYIVLDATREEVEEYENDKD